MRRLAVLVVGLWVGLGWSSAASAVPIQWTTASGGNDHYYEIVTDNPLLWNDAKLFAESRGGYLATLTSAAENAFVTSNSPISDQDCGQCIWLGGFQNTSSPAFSEPSGAWEWVTGEAWSFTNWHPGEPNKVYPTENYLAFLQVAGPGYWNDHRDVPFSRQLIEYDTNPIPEPSTALLLGLGLLAFSAFKRRPASRI